MGCMELKSVAMVGLKNIILCISVGATIYVLDHYEKNYCSINYSSILHDIHALIFIHCKRAIIGSNVELG